MRKLITERIESEPRIRLIREEVTSIPEDRITIIATGPLSSDALTAEIMKLTGSDQMYFYDAIAPIVAADSIDTSIAFRAARYDKGGDDYLNCPFDEEQYARFYSGVNRSQQRPACSDLKRRVGLKRVCRSKSWRGAESIRCVSDR